MKRRDFFEIGVFSTLGLLASRLIKSSGDQNSQNILPGGKLYTIGGGGGSVLIEAQSKKNHEIALPGKNWSVITEIDIPSAQVRQFALPMEKGHSVIPMNNDLFLCVPYRGTRALLWNIKSEEVEKYWDTPSGFVYSGHCVAEHHQFVFPVTRLGNPAKPYPRKHGFIKVVDAKSYSEIGQYPSGGVHPHEIIKTASDKLAVSHYGDPGYPNENMSYAFDNHNSSLTLLDSSSFKVLANLPGGEGIDHGILSHLAMDSEGLIYAPALLRSQGNQLGLELLSKLSENDGSLVPLTRSEYYKKAWSLPGPMRIFDLKNKEAGSIVANLPLKRRRPQSIAHHSLTNTMLTTYSHSDTIGCLRPGEADEKFYNCFDFGIREVRGICDVPGTPFAAICGGLRGIAIIDLRNMSQVFKLDIAVHRASHITYSST